MSKLTNIDYYLDGLDTALNGVTKEVFIHYFNHSKQSLERVFKASCNSSSLIIEYSKLQGDAKILGEKILKKLGNKLSSNFVHKNWKAAIYFRKYN